MSASSGYQPEAISVLSVHGEWYFEPPELHIDIEQHVREFTPRIPLNEVNSLGYSLTPTEAVTIGRALIAAGKLADETT